MFAFKDWQRLRLDYQINREHSGLRDGHRSFAFDTSLYLEPNKACELVFRFDNLQCNIRLAVMQYGELQIDPIWKIFEFLSEVAARQLIKKPHSADGFDFKLKFSTR